jgi:hypothetical protein
VKFPFKCNSSYSTDVAYYWEIVGSTLPIFVATTPRQLFVPAFTLPNTALKVSLTLKHAQVDLATARSTLQVELAPPVAVSFSGAFAQVAGTSINASAALVKISGNLSYDPEGPPSALTHSWCCVPGALCGVSLEHVRTPASSYRITVSFALMGGGVY